MNYEECFLKYEFDTQIGSNNCTIHHITYSVGADAAFSDNVCATCLGFQVPFKFMHLIENAVSLGNVQIV